MCARGHAGRSRADRKNVTSLMVLFIPQNHHITCIIVSLESRMFLRCSDKASHWAKAAAAISRVLNPKPPLAQAKNAASFSDGPARFPIATSRCSASPGTSGRHFRRSSAAAATRMRAGAPTWSGNLLKPTQFADIYWARPPSRRTRMPITMTWQWQSLELTVRHRLEKDVAAPFALGGRVGKGLTGGCAHSSF